MTYKCSDCDKEFSSYQSMGGHKTVHKRANLKYKKRKCSNCYKMTTNPKFCTLMCKQLFHSRRLKREKLKKPVMVHKTKNGTNEYITLDVTNEEVDRYRKLHQSCEICGKKCSVHNKLSVDHNHETGKFRGLLCFRCNIALGHLENHLENTKKYLAKL